MKAHQQILEDWLRTCSHACLVHEKKNPMDIFERPLNPDSESIKLLQLCGHLIYSQANRNAVAFAWRGQHVSTLTWEDFGTGYCICNEPVFPMASKEELFPENTYSI